MSFIYLPSIEVSINLATVHSIKWNRNTFRDMPNCHVLFFSETESIIISESEDMAKLESYFAVELHQDIEDKE